MHGEQKRKYTGEPYVNHCIEVAEIVSEHQNACIEIALCHDLFEDTDCDFAMLHKEMVNIGYVLSYAYETCTCVQELSDKYTHKDYPHLNRKARKLKEAVRLGDSSYKSQSVKYADLISNTKSIVENDKKFAKTYLLEKAYILKEMDKGNSVLFSNCLKSLERSQYELNEM
tara:strand:- start:704 stop:1216 length:513 start_codon:yes stop_codon:yes gene_type:complete